ncbi:MAG: thermonuclease family protein [Magnetococcus sp. WYHC-3]
MFAPAGMDRGRRWVPGLAALPWGVARCLSVPVLALGLLTGAVGFPRSLLGAEVFSSAAAQVIDGDSLRVDGREVRLFGVDAWEWRQTCPDASGQPWPCGQRAAEFMRGLVTDHTITCEAVERDRYQRWVSRCRRDDGLDLGMALVSGGWALAYRRFSREYLPAEEQARRDAVGGWQGGAKHPPPVPTGMASPAAEGSSPTALIWRLPWAVAMPAFPRDDRARGVSGWCLRRR